MALRECRATLREVRARQWSEPTSKSLSLARESHHPENTHSSLVGFCTSGDNWLPSIASESPCACRFEANCLMSVCRISPCTRPRKDPATVDVKIRLYAFIENPPRSHCLGLTVLHISRHGIDTSFNRNPYVHAATG